MQITESLQSINSAYISDLSNDKQRILFKNLQKHLANEKSTQLIIEKQLLKPYLDYQIFQNVYEKALKKIYILSIHYNLKESTICLCKKLFDEYLIQLFKNLEVSDSEQDKDSQPRYSNQSQTNMGSNIQDALERDDASKFILILKNLQISSMILLRMTMKFSENIEDPYKPVVSQDVSLQSTQEKNLVSAYQHIFDVIVNLVIQDKVNIFGLETITQLSLIQDNQIKNQHVEQIINTFMQRKEFEIFRFLDFNLNMPTGADIFYSSLKFTNQDFDFEKLFTVVSQFSIRHIYMTQSEASEKNLQQKSLFTQNIRQSSIFFAYFRLICRLSGKIVFYDLVIQKLSKHDLYNLFSVQEIFQVYGYILKDIQTNSELTQILRQADLFEGSDPQRFENINLQGASNCYASSGLTLSPQSITTKEETSQEQSLNESSFHQQDQISTAKNQQPIKNFIHQKKKFYSSSPKIQKKKQFYPRQQMFQIQTLKKITSNTSFLKKKLRILRLNEQKFVYRANQGRFESNEQIRKNESAQPIYINKSE